MAYKSALFSLTLIALLFQRGICAIHAEDPELDLVRYPLSPRNPEPFRWEDFPDDPIVRCIYQYQGTSVKYGELYYFEIRLPEWKKQCRGRLLKAVKKRCIEDDWRAWWYRSPESFYNRRLRTHVCNLKFYLTKAGPSASSSSVHECVLDTLRCVGDGKPRPLTCVCSGIILILPAFRSNLANIAI